MPSPWPPQLKVGNSEPSDRVEGRDDHILSNLQMTVCVHKQLGPALLCAFCLLFLISMLWHRQAIFESKWDKLSYSAECRIRTQRVSGTESPADWMPADKPTELSSIKLSRIKLKTSTRQPVPMISEHDIRIIFQYRWIDYFPISEIDFKFPDFQYSGPWELLVRDRLQLQTDVMAFSR